MLNKYLKADKFWFKVTIYLSIFVLNSNSYLIILNAEIYLYKKGGRGRDVNTHVLYTLEKQKYHTFFFLFADLRWPRGRCLPRVQEFGVRSPVATYLSHKRGSDSSTAKRSALVRVSLVLGEDHYKRMPHVTVGVARLRTLSAQWPWVLGIGQNLKLFTGNGDVFIWVKQLLSGTINSKKKQTNKLIWRGKA